MVEIAFVDGSVCIAQRVFGVLFPQDPAGDKTYYVAQIDGHRRRLDPKDVRSVNVVVPSA